MADAVACEEKATEALNTIKGLPLLLPNVNLDIEKILQLEKLLNN